MQMAIRWKNTRRLLHRNRSGLVVLLVMWLLFFSRTFSGQAVYFLDDLKIIFYPLEHVYGTFQANGRLPVWSPLFGFGHPLIAWGQLGFFTPLHVLLRLLPLHALARLQVSILTYYLLGSLGMYAFLRRQPVLPMAAALGGVLYAYSGFQIGHLNHVNFYTATLLLPVLLTAVDRLCQRPTAAGSVLVAVVGATMALSGQPQVVLYSFIAAALYTAIRGIRLSTHNPRHLLQLGAALTGATVIALLLSSWAILPLREFLPLTERAQDIPVTELLDFSYPPYNTITLIFPYFFGNHDTYWGPKGFQELAAYVGIIPLFLAAAALCDWRQHRSLRLLALIMIASACLLATGKYSPLYRALVEQHIITNLNIPGRFVFYFTTAVSILAALALDGLTTYSRRRQAALLAGSTVLTALLLAPIAVAAPRVPRLAARISELPAAMPIQLWLVAAGLAAVAALLLWPVSRSRAWQTLAAVLAAATLLVYGWQFNPLTPAEVAFAPSPAAKALNDENRSLPPRLYAAQHLLRTTETATARTEPLSPALTIAWPIHIDRPNLTCIRLPVSADQNGHGSITFRLFTALTNPPLRTVTLDTSNLTTFDQKICFDPIAASQEQTYTIIASTADETTFRLFVRPESRPEYQAHIVRSPNPTAEDLRQAIKPIAILASPAYTDTADEESALLMRQINAVVGASSARWIGALSIKNYRDFIEEFFANDSDEPFDGDGHHAIEANRTLLNMAGVTHLLQNLTAATDDRMLAAGFTRDGRWSIGSSDIVLYQNPDAFPKAFLVSYAIWQPAGDEVRAALHNSTFNPRETVYLGGPTPPQLPLADAVPGDPAAAAVDVTQYESDRITVDVTAAKESVLVVNDTTTPQWHTVIDGRPAPYFTANSMFKAAVVPAGRHTVEFRYDSPAIRQSKKMSLVGFITAGCLLAVSPLKRSWRRLHSIAA